MVGVSAHNNFSTTASAGIGATRRGADGRGESPRSGGFPPGFNQAAQKLHITTEVLFKAMESAGGRNADLNIVADILKINVDDLKAALLRRK